MSTEQTIDNIDLDNLDSFSDTFFGQSESSLEKANSDEAKEPVDTDADAPLNEDTHAEDDDTLDTEDLDSEDTDEADEPAPEVKPKKTRFQERIDELTGKIRSGEREREDLLARIAALETKQNKQDPEPSKPIQQIKDEGPQPDETLEDGTDKYPLGELDPNYIRDLTRYTLKVEREEMRKEEEARVRQEEEQAAMAELQATWNTKLVTAQERYPDYREKGEQLLDTFSGIDKAYGDYLSNTLMAMDHGPDVLYYLASNPQEAHDIVMSGATKATLALGRLEAQFASLDNKPTQSRPKVTKAPAPPAHVNKGSAIASAEVPDDTDDLDAFAAKLFKKK